MGEQMVQMQGTLVPINSGLHLPVVFVVPESCV